MDTARSAKRRKIRKGTHSCWECKRRKMKCVFDPLSGDVCMGCWRRNLQCISQEYSEEVSLSMNQASEAHPSASPEQQKETLNNGFASPVSLSASSSDTPGPNQRFQQRLVESNLTSSANDRPILHTKYERLSRLLHTTLPSRDYVQRLCRASRNPILGHELLSKTYAALEQTGIVTAKSLLDIPEWTRHPVVIARYMLQLATFLQHLPPNLHKEIEGLAEAPRVLMERLVDRATKLVATNDRFFGYIEALDCILIESVYYSNLGNLRRSWLAIRRALSVAQLMDLDQCHPRYETVEPDCEADPQVMWFRITSMDRHLCLILGLPQGCLDCSTVSASVLVDKTPMERLERLDSDIASRILDRNRSAAKSRDLAVTSALDLELQKSAKTLPSKWWTAPDLEMIPSNPESLFWDTRRLYIQVLHYSLLNQLHLPHMLRSMSAGSNREYSRITCVNASREILLRFSKMRTFGANAYSCRTIDFIALMAAMTLLLAHIDGHLLQTGNLLAHQHLSDRAMIEQMLESMRKVTRLNADVLSAQSCDLLERLLAVDARAADGFPDCASRVSVQEAGASSVLSDQGNDAVVSAHIPYFGVIKIAREGVHAEPHPRISGVTGGRRIDAPTHDGADREQTELPSTMPQSAADYCASAGNDVGLYDMLQFQHDVADPLLQQGESLGMADSDGDWAFQGVNVAFLENLMRSAGHDVTADAS